MERTAAKKFVVRF